MITHLSEGIRLYHGSYCEVDAPDLKLCSRWKDFGRGLYLTTDETQARQFSRLSARKARQNGIVEETQDFGVVSVFVFHPVEQMVIKVFEDADAEWLRCVVGHRRRSGFEDVRESMKMYDVIGGKIADDATNATILAYMAGTFGDVGTERAAELCISLLLPERLKDQYCFRTEKALRQLKYVGSERIWL